MNHPQHDSPGPLAPNCWQCEHFAISWDIQRPYSCRIMGFKSKSLPSSEVFKADGQACQCFYPKNEGAASSRASHASHASHALTIKEATHSTGLKALNVAPGASKGWWV